MYKVLLVATVQSHLCQFHRLLADILHEHGCEVHVAARNNLAEKNGLQLDFADKVYDVPFSRSPASTDNIKAYRQLKTIIEDGHYSIIHCNTPMGGIVTRLAARKARKSGTKVFYTAHGFHFYKGAPIKNWLIYYPIEKVFSRLTDKLITIVDEDYQTAKKHFHSSIYRIHGVGVDEQRYTPVNETTKRSLRQDMGYDPDQRIILCVGELLPNKNQKLIISAMPEIIRKIPNAKLLIAGNGPEKERLEQLIASFGLQESVTLLGYITNLQDYQHISDVLVACSLREGLGLNVIEAMMSGNPVVLTDNRGHRELVNHGNNGIMVSTKDSMEMVGAVVQVLSDTEQSQCFSQNAVEFSKLYGYKAVKKELERIYEF